MFLDAHAKVELTYFLNNIVHMNGKRIINSRSPIKVVYPHERTYTAEFERDIDATNELFMCSDASESMILSSVLAKRLYLLVFGNCYLL